VTAVADSLAEVVDRMSAQLEARTAEAADARARLELTERAESTLREERDRVRQELDAERERREQAERERDELAAELAALEQARESAQTTAEAAGGVGSPALPPKALRRPKNSLQQIKEGGMARTAPAGPSALLLVVRLSIFLPARPRDRPKGP
jgi:DNA repair exonuclease SbcCD ATPase subunit